MPLDKDIDNAINPLIKSFDSTLKTTVNGHLVETYVSGSAETISWGKTKGGIPITYEGPPISQAISWAEKRGAELVTEMGPETKRRLAHTISSSIERKRGIPGTAQDIRKWAEELNKDVKKTLVDMSRYRSQLIARTETANALSQASLDRMDDMGIEGKEWVTAGDSLVSPECSANEGEGVIPVNQAFSSGAMAPPQHPNCRCAVAPAILKKK